jgi:sarcosine oxidase subunit alpha
MTARRLDRGGRIDRGRTLTLRFDGRDIAAHPGDTLASAMLAADIRLVGRSFKYHRPRGVMAAGVEEANALVHLREGDRREPNTPATVVEAFDGLVATSQNAWPGLRFDIGAVNGVASRFLGAGFYYKTFIGPFKGTRFWMVCEAFIRRAAGMGRATTLDDPDAYEKVNAFCDLLVVGSGPAGLSAALAAAEAGREVVLAEQDSQLGGSILSTPVGGAQDQWREEVLARLAAMPNVRLMSRTTVFGAYDSNVFGMVERVADHLAAPSNGMPRQRYWLLRAKQAVLATGAIERPLVFAGNDVPGVMLASAAATYVHRYAVLPGERAVIATNNDSAYAAAVTLARAGAKVILCDIRASVPKEFSNLARAAGVDLRPGHAVLKAQGGQRVTGARIVAVNGDGRPSGAAMRVACDLIAMSGGWAPVLHLWSQRFGKPVYRPELDAFVPADRDGIACAGSLMGVESFDACREQGASAGGGSHVAAVPESPTFFWGRNLSPVSVIAHAGGRTPGKAFVDFQHDVKLADIDQAHREGFVSVEHLKRYTTSGMAADQGKTSNLNALARLAALRGMEIPAVGTTTFRPPYTPVSIGTLVGHEFGLHFRPIRRTAVHGWHLDHGAAMTEAGLWLRPQYYPQAGESLREAYVREAAHVRAHVGLVDVSTLGKIAVQGPDAAEFLDRLYTNKMGNLAPGRLRYGLMLREDGFVHDDGIVACLGEGDYLVSTTTANAAAVLANAEHLLQTAWRDLRVHVTSVTDYWAAFAVAGPKSRALLASLIEADISNAAFPANAHREVTVDGVACRLHRTSYSGELAYEILVPSTHGLAVWKALVEAGGPLGVGVYGTEAMGALRIEKGHVALAEMEGRTTMGDLGMEGLASRRKPFVGSVLRLREVLADPSRPTLVGLKIDGSIGARAGALLFSRNDPATGHGEGWVSSTTWSPALGCNIALALLRHGAERMGERVRVVDLVGDLDLSAEVVSPKFFDPEGHRQNA